MINTLEVPPLLTIKLLRLKDRSVKGVLPDGTVITWPADYSNKPTQKSRRVMVNCCNWRPVWIDADSLPSDEDLARQRLDAAQAAFERYDFLDACIEDADGWDTSRPLDYTRMTYSDSGRFNLHVRFEALTATVRAVEAYDMQTGNTFGSMPSNHKEAQA
jgi:hypothetical protein